MALRDLLNAYKTGNVGPAPAPAPAPPLAAARPAKPAAAPSALTVATPAELLALQKYLLPHLTACRHCAAEGGTYCNQAARDEFREYLRAVGNVPGGARLHDAFVAAVIQSRLRGVFAGLDALAQPVGKPD